jgi:integrase
MPAVATKRRRSNTFVRAAFDQFGYPFGPLFKMLLVTGQRRGEVAGMRWSEIGADGWRIPSERSKNSKGHLAPLSSLAREILADVPQIGELVFRSHHDTPLQGWSRAMKRLQKLCGPMEPWHLHDLRRTFATHLRSLGIDRLVVSKLLNHAEGGVTKIYDRYTGPRWRDGLIGCARSSGSPAANVVQLRIQ